MHPGRLDVTQGGGHLVEPTRVRVDGADPRRAVVALAAAIATQLGLDDRDQRDIATAAQIYDIGKSEIPAGVLHKPAALNAAELEVMRDGPIIAARVVAAVDALSSLAPIVRAVHERWDGTGYPDRLTGAQIPLAARVIAVADAYHAMIADRPYREAIDPGAALAELHQNAGGQFWPAAVTALSSVLPA